MQTPKSSTPAFDILKNYIPAIVLVGTGFVSMVAFWYDSKAVAKKVDTNKSELDALIHNLDDKVTRQYSVQREMNDKTNKEVDDLQEWKAWQEGYKKGIEDANKK